MALFIYNRVSTLEQNYDQQMQDIKAYFAAHGLKMEDVAEIVAEHESGGKSYTDRKFQQLLNKCKPGDYIYAASTDRLGRNFIDMMRRMEDAKKRGVIIVACTANKKAWQREQIAKQGYFIIENGPNAGERCTYVGSPKLTDMSEARQAALAATQEAAALANQEAKIRWSEQSKGYNWVRTQLAKGKSRALILEEFNELHTADPENYSTREGKPLSKGVLSKWCREMNPLAV